MQTTKITNTPKLKSLCSEALHLGSMSKSSKKGSDNNEQEAQMSDVDKSMDSPDKSQSNDIEEIPQSNDVEEIPQSNDVEEIPQSIEQLDTKPKTQVCIICEQENDTPLMPINCKLGHIAYTHADCFQTTMSKGMSYGKYNVSCSEDGCNYIERSCIKPILSDELLTCYDSLHFDTEFSKVGGEK